MADSGPRDKAPSPDEPAAPGDYSGPERRQSSCDEDDVEPVILTKKFAEALDGIELGESEVGDRLCLTTDQAALIVAEGWATPAAPDRRRGGR